MCAQLCRNVCGHDAVFDILCIDSREHIHLPAFTEIFLRTFYREMQLFKRQTFQIILVLGNIQHVSRDRRIENDRKLLISVNHQAVEAFLDVVPPKVQLQRIQFLHQGLERHCIAVQIICAVSAVQEDALHLWLVHMAAVAEHLEEHFFLLQGVQCSKCCTVCNAHLFDFARNEVEGLLRDFFFRQPLEETVEFQFLVQCDQRIVVRLLHAHLVEVHLHRHETVDRGQSLAHHSKLCVLFDFFAQCRLRNLVGMRQQIFYRMKLREQRDPCLFTDTRDPRDIVGAVSHQSLEVDELRRCQSVMLDHFIVIK